MEVKKINKRVNLPSWYKTRRGDEIALSILLMKQDGVRAIRLSGPPGVGKTALARAVSEALGGSFIYFLAHHWVSEEDLFVKIDPARVAGLAGGVYENMEDAYRPGVLLRAVLSSKETPTVLCLDEWDKSPERADALLLEFLQTGKVHGPFGEVWEGNLSQLFVVITDNGMRTLSEPLLRRVYRYEMSFLPPQEEALLIRQASGVPMNVAKTIVTFMGIIRREGQSSPSLQEGQKLASALSIAESAEDVKVLIEGFLVKEEEDWEALIKNLNSPHSILWGEIRRSK